jgi:hypothetical protein
MGCYLQWYWHWHAMQSPKPASGIRGQEARLGPLSCLPVCTSYRPSVDSSLLSRSGGGKTLTLDWAERAESSPLGGGMLRQSLL